MDEKGKTLVKLLIGIPVILILIFFCMPREYGNTESSVLRNIVRETLSLPFSVDICHVEDFAVHDGMETMRGVVFDNERENPLIWSDQQYRIHWYQLNDEGNYELYWGDEGTSGGWMCQGVYHFPALSMHGYEDTYDLYYVTDPEIKEIILKIQYKIGKENDEIKTQTEYASVAVDHVPELICIPSFISHPFRPEIYDDPSFNEKGCTISVSAFDEERNLLYGDMEKEINLHNIYTIEKY